MTAEQIKEEAERLYPVLDDHVWRHQDVTAKLQRAAYMAGASAHGKGEFQSEVDKWMNVCFGEQISKDSIERNHRFLEESLELVQSLECTQSEAHQLVDYVFNRPKGEPYQEVGGVMVTLSALCSANELNMNECAETELKRIWTKVEKIREKQAAKPKHSPLPESKSHGEAEEIFPGFWNRLLLFVENVKVNDAMSQEEKEIIINVVKAQVNK